MAWLAEELRCRGARALVARLPADGDEKVGLDDYLAAHPKREFDALLAGERVAGGSGRLATSQACLS